MKKTVNYLVILSLMLITFACNGEDPFEPSLTVSLETETLLFSNQGGAQDFELESNELWSVGEVPEWILVKVKDMDVATRGTTYAAGKKNVTVVVEPNPGFKMRTADILLSSASGKKVQLTVEQDKSPELVGYWILSEGSFGSNNSELAWYDVAKGELSVKQFEKINGVKLGDTGNDLEIYGSKMYCVVTGPGTGASGQEGTNYIEVINPADGKSIKRIPFTDAQGNPAKPRFIVFEGGKGYVSSYSKEVVRLDTATLTLDAHATLSGTFAEELAICGKNIYVCNSGQGNDDKISVVDIKSMKEVKVITTEKNPTGIIAVDNERLFFNTSYPKYNVYSIDPKTETIEQVEKIKGNTLTYVAGNIYLPYFDWNNYTGTVYVYHPQSQNKSKLLLDYESVGIMMLMEYKMGVINGSDDIFLSGQGQDMLIIDPYTKSIKYSFQTKVPCPSGVVAYYR
jgi:hypothetical protein